MRISGILLLLSVLMPAAAISQNTVQISAGKSNDYGLTYTLPLTAIDVTVVAERTQSKPGDLYRYAGKYLNIDNPVREESENWRIADVILTPVGVQAGNDRRYQVQFRSGATPVMTLTEEGFPLSINMDDDGSRMRQADLPQSQPAEPSVLETSAARQAMTEDMIKSQSTAKRAELAAAKIFEIRQSRNDIISGQADNMPGDGKAMQLALDNLSAQEAALTAMFAGTRQTSTEVRTFRILPDGNTPAARIPVARVSATEGFVDNDNLSGMPVTLEISNVISADMPVNEKGEPKRFPKGGLAYTIPGTCTVKVTDQEGRELARLNGVPVAQFGSVFGLEPNLFTDKKLPASARFSPTTGALIELR